MDGWTYRNYLLCPTGYCSLRSLCPKSLKKAGQAIENLKKASNSLGGQDGWTDKQTYRNYSMSYKTLNIRLITDKYKRTTGYC